MSGWIKLRESWPGERRVERLGGDAAMLHVSACGYSARDLSDGLVPHDQLRKLWPAVDLGDAIKRLLDGGFWTYDSAADAYTIVEWQEHLLAADEVARIRKSNAERQERHRRHKADDHSMCDYCAAIKAGANHSVTNAVSNATPNRPAPNRALARGSERGGAGSRAADAALAAPPRRHGPPPGVDPRTLLAPLNQSEDA